MSEGERNSESGQRNASAILSRRADSDMHTCSKKRQRRASERKGAGEADVAVEYIAGEMLLLVQQLLKENGKEKGRAKSEG